LSFILILLIFAAFGIITIFEIRTINTIYSQIKTADVGAIDLLDKMSNAIIKIRLLEEELLLTSDEVQTKRVVAEIDGLIRLIKEGSKIYNNIAESPKHVDMLNKFDSFFDNFSKICLILVQDKFSRNKSVEALQIDLNESKNNFERLQYILESIIAEENNDILKRLESGENIYNGVRNRISIIFAALIIFGIALTFYLVDRFAKIYKEIDESLKIEITKNKIIVFFNDRPYFFNRQKLLYLICEGLGAVAGSMLTKNHDSQGADTGYERTSIVRGEDALPDGAEHQEFATLDFLLRHLETLKEPIFYEVGLFVSNHRNKVTGADENRTKFADLASEKGFKSAIFYPVMNGGEFKHVIALFFPEDLDSLREYKVRQVNQIVQQVDLLLSNMYLINELKSKNDLLHKQNNELDAYSRTVSHDLKNPLSAVLGYLQMISYECAKPPGSFNLEKIKKFAGTAEAAGKTMERLISDILAFSQAKNVILNVDNVNMKKLMNDVMEVFSEKIKSENIEVVIADNLPVIRADALCMERIFTNLVSNSIKYIGNVPKKTISISYNDERVNHHFTYRDTGAGISKKYHQNIFTPFFRTHENENAEGTGVGLSIIKNIIERHGGRIWFESGQGAGTTFFIEIPKNL